MDTMDFSLPFTKENSVRYELSDVRKYLGNYQEAVEKDEDFFLEDEGIPLPDELLNPEYGPQSEGSALVTGEKSGQEKGAAEIQYRDSNERLSLFVYGEEKLSVGNSLLGKSEHISVNSKRIVRTVFDDHYRVKEKDFFNNSTVFSDIKIQKLITYSYVDETSPNLSSVNEKLFTEKKRRETIYSESGDPKLVLLYETPDEGNEWLLRRTSRKFDDKKRLIQEEEIRYDEEKELLRRRNEYVFTEKSSVPNLSFYENGILRLIDEYESEGVHKETLLFDDDYRVTVRYEHGRKTEEIISLGGKEISRRNFDQ